MTPQERKQERERFRFQCAMAAAVAAITTIALSILDHTIAPPAPRVTVRSTLTETCDNVCDALDMRHVAHDETSVRGGYGCVCLSADRTCAWYSAGRVDCAVVAMPEKP